MTDWTPETLAAEIIRMSLWKGCGGCAQSMHDVCVSYEQRARYKGSFCSIFNGWLERVLMAEKERGET